MGRHNPLLEMSRITGVGEVGIKLCTLRLLVDGVIACTMMGAQAILDNTSGVGDSFIAAMVAAAKTNGYAGYNLDWELGDGSGAPVGSSYTGKSELVPFGFPSLSPV